MPIFYVDSNATGLNDGSDWTNAYTAFQSAVDDTSLAAGDFIYVADNHSESLGATTTYTFNDGTQENPIKCISGTPVGATDITPNQGATVLVTGVDNTLSIEENVYMSGMDLGSDNGWIFLARTTDGYQRYQDCIFRRNQGVRPLIIGQDGGGMEFVEWVDCEWHVESTACPIAVTNAAFWWDGGSFTIGASGPSFLFDDSTLAQPGRAIVRDVDMSAFTGDILDLSGIVDQRFHVQVERCRLNSATNLTSGSWDIDATPELEAVMRHCQVTADSDPSFQLEHHNRYGTTTVDTARYRTGGASDGERANPVSWRITTNANLTTEWFLPYVTPWINAWTDGDGTTAHTYDIFVAHNAVGDGTGGHLQNDQIWVELELPNDLDTHSNGEFDRSTRMALLGTPADQPTDSVSSWTGTEVGTRERLRITFTPDKPGPIRARIHFSPGDTTDTSVNVDPQIVIDG